MSATKHTTTWTEVVHCPDAVLLCVDDDPWILAVTKMVLESNGYSVLTAANGQEALEVFHESCVDLVLVEYQMPDMNGDEVAIKIKGLAPHVPVVLQSAATELPEAVTMAADAFFPKGADVYLLVAVIAKLIISNRSNGHLMGANGARGSQAS